MPVLCFVSLTFISGCLLVGDYVILEFLCMPEIKHKTIFLRCLGDELVIASLWP